MATLILQGTSYILQVRLLDLFFGMLKCLTPTSYEMRKMSEDELKSTLRAFLREKRYFIVMDDIWKLYVWNEVRQVLPDSFNGSRILITTRVKDVAMYSSQTPPYALSFLDNKTSFQLFCRKDLYKKIDERKVEDVAEEYLMELIHRNLIQVASRRTDGGVKTCRIHDLIRDLSIFESAREKFLEIHSEDSLSSISKARRLSIQGNISEYISTDPRDPCHAHSLVMFGEGNKFDMKHWRWIHKSLKFIRVLCLENMHVDSIPKEIGKLIFLRYLRIWSETLLRIHSIPSSICNLQYLETIGINGHVEECLPMGFWKMKQLRHLKISGGIRFPSTPAPFDDILLNLQVLSYLLVDKKTTHLNALSRVPNIRMLHLKYDVSKPMNEFEVAELLESLENLKQLQKLKLFDIPKSEPRSNLFPPTLIKLTFIRSYLNSAHFRILGKLPNLQFLKIKGKFLGFNILHPLCYVAGEFPNLQVFQMISKP
nr:toMV susceptible protein tm-2-like [Ziziphus jujuba var. spinosa]